MAAKQETRLDRAQTEEMAVIVVDEDRGEAIVHSKDGGSYDVVLNGAESSCECPDHEYRGTTCKHMLRVADEIGVVALEG